MDSPAKEAALPSAGTTVQRTSVLHTQEIVRVQFHLEYKRTLFFYINLLSSSKESKENQTIVFDHWFHFKALLMLHLLHVTSEK